MKHTMKIYAEGKLENMDERKADTQESDFHGGNIYRIFREKNIKEILDYSSNINPYGIPDKLKEVLIENLSTLEKYPDPDYVELREKIAEKNNVSIRNIVLGNGATEIIFLFMKILNPKKILIISPTFSEYERAVKATEGYGKGENNKNNENDFKIKYFRLSEEEEFDLNMENLMHELEDGYDLLIMCNPNNPTGKFLKLKEMDKILERCNNCNIKFLVDEAFIDFVENGEEESIINTKKERKNLFVIRAFTKFFAVPGVRLGYGVYFDGRMEDEISEKKEPWSVNNIAELTGKTVLEDREYIERTLRWIRKEKDYMYGELQSIDGIKPYRTEVNFILVKIEDGMIKKGINAGRLKEMMLEEGILIRDASNFKYLDESYFRLAIKDRKNNDEVIGILEKCLEAAMTDAGTVR